MAITYRQHTLPNGLNIIAEVDSDAHTAAAGFFVKTGARDETSEIMGVSHFLEHMMFKGTDDLTANDLNRRFDEIGARNNAYTSNELTCFYAQVLPEHLTEATELLGRMMRPALRDTDFDTEKGVILEEIAMYKDNPFWVLYEATTERHFLGHPLQNRVLGTSETITSLKSEQMRKYFSNRYSADNTVVALAGKIDYPAVVDQVETLCGAWKPTRVTRDNAPPPLTGGEVVLRDEKVSRAYLLGMCDAPCFADDRRYAAMMLSQVLGASDNSLLHWALIETGMAEEATASYAPHDGFGEFFVFAVGDPARSDQIWREITVQMDRLLDAMSEDDLIRLRNKAATAATLGAERPGDRMQRLGQFWTYLGRYAPIETELEKINRITMDDLRACYEAFPMRMKTVGRLLPRD